MKLKHNFIDWKTWFSFAGVGIVGLALLLILSDSISDKISDWIFGRQENGAVVGKLVQLNGSAKVISGNREKSVIGPINDPIILLDGDRLEVSAKSQGSLILNSQDEFLVKPTTNLMLQLWNARDGQSPVYVTLLSGQLELQKAGVRGRAYLVKQGRLFMPGQEMRNQRLNLILNQKEIDIELSENQLSEDTSEELDSEGELDVPEEKLNTSEPETLSNEYIDDSISRKQISLQKCWLSRVKNSPVHKGRLVVQFEISRRGKVKDTKIIESDFNDETLHNCIIGVIQRINFRSFKGPEISLSYPIQLE